MNAQRNDESKPNSGTVDESLISDQDLELVSGGTSAGGGGGAGKVSVHDISITT